MRESTARETQESKARIESRRLNLASQREVVLRREREEDRVQTKEPKREAVERGRPKGWTKESKCPKWKVVWEGEANRKG